MICGRVGIVRRSLCLFTFVHLGGRGRKIKIDGLFLGLEFHGRGKKLLLFTAVLYFVRSASHILADSPRPSFMVVVAYGPPGHAVPIEKLVAERERSDWMDRERGAGGAGFIV